MKKFFTRFATIAMSMAAIFAFVSCEENKADDGVMPESDATAGEQTEPEEIEKSGCKSAAAPVAALIGAAALAVYKKKKETV